jgi:hypothetical protein
VKRPVPRRGGLPALLTVLCAGFAGGAAHGQSGWLPASWFSQAEVDAKQMFPLAEKDGPWLVLATTFRGAGAREDARALVQELRSRHRLQAYTHEKSFDYTGRQKGVGFNPDGSPKTMRYANAAQVLEVAVLVGDFASCEDARAQKALQKVKGLRPAALGGADAKGGLVSEFLQANQQHLAAAGSKPPMHAAILIPNPLLPADYFNRHEVDAFVEEMNADVTHGLLDCPARYSVRVATFTGSGIIGGAADAAASAPTSGGLVDVKKLIGAMRGQGWQDPQLRGLPGESRLVEAADKAHRLTESLRRAGWQAWEFHDRESSIVCVGGIEQLAVQQADGKAAVNPEIARIVAGLGPNPAKLAQGVIEPRSFDGIFLDIDPKPIEVPRKPARRR